MATAKKTAAKTTSPKTAKTTAKKTASTKKTASKTAKKKTAAASTNTAAASPVAGEILQRFADIGGWRGPLLARVRNLILSADPALVEERKWIKPSNPFGVPTYSRAGLVLTLEVYKEYVKVTFAQGSKVDDPRHIFNASLLGLRRAIDFREGVDVDEAGFQALVRGAVAVNLAKRG